MSGWIKLYRKIWENPRSSDPAWVSIWIYLITHASYGGLKAKFNGEIIVLKPGQIVTGRKAISDTTGVNESKTQRVLTVLKSEQQIEQQTCSRSRLITILNWDEYQCDEQQYEPQMNNKRTTNEQQMNTTKKERKKERKKDIMSDVQKIMFSLHRVIFPNATKIPNELNIKSKLNKVSHVTLDDIAVLKKILRRRQV